MENRKEKAQKWARQLAIYAQQAVLYEAVLFPKPGLVDAQNSGSHEDMNIYTFLNSSTGLMEGFYEFALMGINWKGEAKKLFQAIRPIGIDAEKAMFKETKGINTHKGIIFSLGIFLAAAGKILQPQLTKEKSFPIIETEEREAIFLYIKEMTSGLVSNDFKNLHLKEQLTHGEKLYLEYGFTGIRGEAEAGYPILQQKILPMIEKQDKNQAFHLQLLEILFYLMTFVEDSNLVHRGGIDALLFVQEEAKKLLQEEQRFTSTTLFKIEQLNQLFMKKNLSPGGSADLLIIVIFLGKLENIF
ncbi:triphosphoribosyl-dephospho-CoA synthase CitG [Carnobacterium mobile]|uniref:triphosphoribosyl-dephospho-CoA synthase CitG n=1 Tax=Carnobacterium mobile TaxID=2750 RepID=UPI00068E222B|nr:triphosphoribosyl-dephospho-CoA synthase CitG [Carnobacterium mobile]